MAFDVKGLLEVGAPKKKEGEIPSPLQASGVGSKL
jgi:hypothetical protein